jgi:hypothetical protein
VNTIPVSEFEAEYRVKYTGGRVEWLPCRVVGIHVPDTWSQGSFVIMIEDDDGAIYASAAEAVRRL